jgi:hypothetical protein
MWNYGYHVKVNILKENTIMANLTENQRTALIEYYVAILDRAPDASGLAFWSGVLQQKLDVLPEAQALDYVANEMWNSPGAKAEYPASLLTTEVVTKIYANILNRAPDAGGLAFWTAEWNTKGPVETFQAMINNLKTNTSTAPQFLADKALFDVKVAFGEWFAVDLFLTDPVSANDAALAQAGFVTIESYSDELLAANGNAAALAIVKAAALADAQELDDIVDPAETIILEDITDIETTGNNNDKFVGNEMTLNSTDDLDGGDGDDVLSFSVQTDDYFGTIAPTLSNIEKISVTAGGSNYAWGTIDLSRADGYEVLELFQNEELYFTWADIQNVESTDLTIIDTYGSDDSEVNYVYDTNAYKAGSAVDTAHLTVAEVGALGTQNVYSGVNAQVGPTINFENETPDGSPSSVDAVDLQSLWNGQVTDTNANYIYDLNVGGQFRTLTIGGNDVADLLLPESIDNVDGNLEIESFLDPSLRLIDATQLSANLTLDVDGNQGTNGDATEGVYANNGRTFSEAITILGAQGNDFISIKDSTNALINLVAGNDTLIIGSSTDFSDTTSRDQDVQGHQTIDTGAGNDAVYANLTGIQSIALGTGNDALTLVGDVDNRLTSDYGDGVSTVTAGDGADTVSLTHLVQGTYNEYTVDLGTGDDRLTIISNGHQTVVAGEGADSVTITGDGNDSVNGGAGADTISITGNGNQTIVSGPDDATDGADRVTIQGNGYHNISLGNGNDLLTIKGATTSLSVATTIKAGAGDDTMVVYGDHRFNLTAGDENDTLEMNARDLESQDTVNMGGGNDTIILHNGAGATNLTFGANPAGFHSVGLSETAHTSGVEVFDLREGNIELVLTTGLFQTAATNAITVKTELSSYVKLPTLTYQTADTGNNISAFSEGMKREDWESIVEDWEDGLYVQDDAYAKTEAGLIKYLFDNGVQAVDFLDNNQDGDEEVILKSAYPDGKNSALDPNVAADDEDQVFFRTLTSEQTVDLTEVDFSQVPNWYFTLQGGNVRDVLVANDDFITGNYTLRFDSAGGDAESVTDTLVVKADEVSVVNITALDEERITGLEYIQLQGDEDERTTFRIELTKAFVEQTTGSEDLHIFLDPDLANGSVLELQNLVTGTPSNGVRIHTNNNVIVKIDGVVVTAGTYGYITISNELRFSEGNDSLVGGAGDDMFIAESVNDLDSNDAAYGGEGAESIGDTLLLQFGVSAATRALEDQLEAHIQDIEILRFVQAEVDEMSIPNTDAGRTTQNIAMTSLRGGNPLELTGVLSVFTGSGNDDLRLMEAGVHYYTYSGDDTVSLAVGGGNFYVHGGLGNDSVTGSDSGESIYLGGVESVNAGAGADWIEFNQSGDGDAFGNDGDTYVNGGTDGSGTDGLELDDDGTNGTVYASHVEYIYGGDGNDSISTYNNDGQTLYVYADDYYGTGNDYVYVDSDNGDVNVFGESGNDTILIADADDNIYVDGDGGYYADGADSIVVHAYGEFDADGVTIYGGGGDDSIYFDTNGTSDEQDADFIDGEGGNDTIWVYSYDNATVEGGSGADSISVSTWDDASVLGEAGDDILYVDHGYSTGGAATINGGDGNDTMTILSDNSDGAETSTITGGQGDDSITLSGNINGGIDTLVFGNVTYDALQKINLNSQTAEAIGTGVDAALASDGDIVNNFNWELGGPGSEDLLDFDAFLGYDFATADFNGAGGGFNTGIGSRDLGVRWDDWTGGVNSLDLEGFGDDIDAGIAVIAAQSGFILNGTHISESSAGTLQIDDNGRAVVIIGQDTDTDGGYDKFDVYFVQDVDTDAGTFFAVDKVATLTSITEIGTIDDTTIGSNHFV